MTSTLPPNQLLSEAAKAGLDRKEVRRILWAIVAPATLDDLPEVLGKLVRVLLVVDGQWPGTLCSLEMATWPETISKLQPIAAGSGYPTTPVDARHLGKRGGGTGHRQRNAVYSALLALPDDGSEYSVCCNLVMAHVFLAHFRVLSIPAGTKLRGGLIKGDTSITAYETYSGSKPWPTLTISPKNCSLALRALFCGEAWARVVVSAYPANLPPLQFAGYAGLVFDGALLQSGISQDWLDQLQDYLLFYLAQAYGLKPRHRGRGQKPQSNGTKSGADKGNDAKASDAFRHDVCPDEDGDDETDDNGATGSDESGGAAPPGKMGKQRRSSKKGNKGGRQQHKGTGNAAGGGSDQAIRASKSFPFATDRPSPSDLAVIDIDCRRRAEEVLNELKTAARTSGTARDADPAEQDLKAEVELLLYVLVMLWTNSDIERTRGMRVYLSKECNDQITLAILMAPGSEGAEAWIRIHVVFPADAPRREPLPPYDRDRTEYVILPDTSELGPLLWNFLLVEAGTFPTANPLSAIEVFRRSLEYYDEHVPRLLAQLTGGRLQASTLASALYDEIMSWSHKDSSATTMITGDLQHKARVQMFYAVRRMKSLQEIYAGTVRYLRTGINLVRPTATVGGSEPNALSTLLRLERQTYLQTPFVPAPENEKYVAINACPTDGAMRQAVQHLIASVEDLWAKSPSSNWIEAHNLYTYYVVWFFGFVTGARPIVCPFLRPSEIDERTMCGRLQDKGVDKARLVWITEELLSQMKIYDAYNDGTRLATLTEYPSWFLDARGAPEPVCEVTCEPILHRFLPGFPTNIHRRWMFNALLDSGCPYVAEWAGHFLTGSRLVGRSATAAPSVVGQQILQYVQPIISYLGFRPIKVEIK
jgi:hypothetical protein